MGRRHRFVCAAVTALALCTGLPRSARAASVTLDTVGAYATNAGAAGVDANASGNALSSTSANDVAGFTSAVNSAFAANRGGVLNFELGANNTSVTAFVANYGTGKTKSLTITPSVTLSDQGGFSQSTPVSGTFAALPATTTVVNYDLVFGGLTGGDPGEVITQTGLTVLSRGSNSFYPLAITVTGHLASGGTVAATATVSNAKGTGDTFYGLTAPAGDSITSLSLSANPAAGGDARIIVDDLGFITSVPEPTSLALAGAGAGAGAGALLARRRRRR